MRSESDIRAQLDQRWRASEFVVAYANGGDRGRMRGSSTSPTGVLHRATCGTLSADKRALATSPADVYPTTVEEFRREANATNHAGKVKVCQLCASDIEVTGQRVIPPPVRDKNDKRAPAEIVAQAVLDRYVENGRESTVAGLVSYLKWSETRVRRALDEGMANVRLGIVSHNYAGSPTTYAPHPLRLRNEITRLRQLVTKTTPLLVRLGDFIGNAEGRCDVLQEIAAVLHPEDYKP